MPKLLGLGVAQDGWQGRDEGHTQSTQERQDVTASPAAVDAVFMLQRYDVHVVDVQKVGGAVIRVDILLRQFEPNAGRGRVARLRIVDRQGAARGSTAFGRDGLTQVGGERGDAAL